MSISFLIPNFACVVTNKRENILNIILILLRESFARGGTWGCWGVKIFSVGICDGAPSTARSSLICNMTTFIFSLPFNPTHRLSVCVSTEYVLA